MRTSTTRLILAAMVMILAASCSTYYEQNVQLADGSTRDRKMWVQVGGKGEIERDADGNIRAVADNEKSFRDGATGAVLYGLGAQQQRTERTRIGETNQTERAAIGAQTDMEKERLRRAAEATGAIANPETPPEAGRTIGNLFRRR